MKRVAKFEKISYKQFEKDWMDTYGIRALDTNERRRIESIYNEIKLPKRATSGSAGYDFFAPETFILEPGKIIKIPTGIRCSMDENWVLKIYPRSGLGFKYRETLANTVGIIDSDYFYSDNEGHIFIKVVNAGNKTFDVMVGTGFAQGIFVEYGITDDDHVTDIRNGGLGSTDK